MSRIRKVAAPFAQVAWKVVQDKSLDFVAIGIYSYIQSLPDDWDISVERLAKVKDRNGIAVVRRAVNDLMAAGLYHRIQVLEAGRPRTYVVVTPMPATFEEACEMAGLTPLNQSQKPALSEGAGSRTPVNPDLGEVPPHIEKTHSQERLNTEKTQTPAPAQPVLSLVDLDAVASSPAPQADRFEDFWKAYPRHVAKGAAERAWKQVVKAKVDPDTVIAAAQVYAQVQNPDFYKHPATWLNAKCWLDELKPKPAARPSEASWMRRRLTNDPR